MLKSATLSSSKCAPFGNMMFQVAPIVKVAVRRASRTWRRSLRVCAC